MNALTLYEYVVPEVSPLLMYVVTLGPVVFIRSQGFFDAQSPNFLYSSKPVSLALLSVHLRFIWVENTRLAISCIGLYGTVAEFVAGEHPLSLHAFI